MMKKLAKLTALLAVAAFLLAGFPACSSDDDDGDPTLDKIEIKVDESKVKTTYTVGEDFDRTGITVTATYSDGSTKDVSDEAKYEATCNGTEFTTATAGDFEVTLTATYGGKTDSVTCPIKVKAGSTTDPTLTGIKITVDESKVKTTYTVGEDFDRTGITVTATYSDGSTKDVSDEAKYEATCDGAAFTTATAGDFEVTLTATYGGKTDSVTCPIKVKAGGISGGGNEGENQGGDGNGGTGGEETPGTPGSGGKDEDEETPDAFESWELDFTSDELKPAKNSSLTAGQVIGNVLTVDAPGSGNLNAAGYIKVGDGGKLSFDVKADATFTFTFANSNSDRTVTLKTDSTQVGDAITVDKAEHSVSLKKGLCTIEFAGGDIQISKMSLTYAN